MISRLVELGFELEVAVQERVRELWRDARGALRERALALWGEPELGLMEERSSRVLSEWLGSEGFSISTDAGLPTAFVASSGDGDPTIGFLLEYDALPALSNGATPERRPLVFNGAGHACGHNLIGTANAAAAIAVARYLREERLPGRIVAYGTPAEEILVGKVAMLDAGVFDGCDVLLTHHADYTNAAVSRPCQSIVHFEIAFRGRPAHTGVTRARNALDAAELFVQTVERLRAHQFPDVLIEHAIRSPTYVMPSNTPEEIRVWLYVRHAEYALAEDAYRRLVGQARAAGAAVNVEVESAVVSSCRGYLPNDVLGELLFEQLQLVGPPQLDEDEVGFLRELVASYAPEGEFELRPGIEYLRDGIDAYGQDDGELSWRIPLGRVNYACPTEIALHSWAATALFASDAAVKGAAMCSEALALAGAALATQPGLVAAARSELLERSPTPPLRSVKGEWEAMLRDPARFWAGSWEFPHH